MLPRVQSHQRSLAQQTNYYRGLDIGQPHENVAIRTLHDHHLTQAFWSHPRLRQAKESRSVAQPTTIAVAQQQDEPWYRWTVPRQTLRAHRSPWLWSSRRPRQDARLYGPRSGTYCRDTQQRKPPPPTRRPAPAVRRDRRLGLTSHPSRWACGILDTTECRKHTAQGHACAARSAAHTAYTRYRKDDFSRSTRAISVTGKYSLIDTSWLNLCGSHIPYDATEFSGGHPVWSRSSTRGTFTLHSWFHFRSESLL